MLYVFGDHELDEARFELRRRGEPIAIQAQPLRLLIYLARNRHRLVLKEELLERVWPDVHVSESALAYAVKRARDAVGDDADGQRVLRTVHGKGYRFAAPLRELADDSPNASRAMDRSPSGSHGSPMLVGRDAILSRLEGLLRDACDGRGRIALIVGEGGIGKTSLAEAAARRARELGTEVQEACGFGGDESPPFWLWRSVLRRHVAGRGGMQAPPDAGTPGAGISALVPELAGNLSEAGSRAALPPREARLRAFERVADLLVAAARERPLVLVFDDLHRADETSLRLLPYLAQRIAAARIFVLAALRDEERSGSPALVEVLRELEAERVVDRIQLDGLDLEGLRTYLEALTDRAPAEEACHAIRSWTGGNPFFVRELVRLHGADSLLALEGDSRLGSLELSPGIRATLAQRLDRISVRTGELLRAASVIGSEFDVELLAHVLSTPPSELVPQLQEACDARLVEPAPDHVARYRFVHALLRETLYQDAPRSPRSELHRRAAEGIEAIAGQDLEAHLPALAHHLWRAAPFCDLRRAVDFATRAGQRAFALSAYEDAARHFGAAVEIADLAGDGDEANRCDLLLQLGQARTVAGLRSAAREAYRRAASTARAMRDAERLGRAALGFAIAVRSGEAIGDFDQEGALLLQEALSVVPPGGLHAWIQALLSMALSYDPALQERAIHLAEDAIAEARQLAIPLTLAISLYAGCQAMRFSERVPSISARSTLSAEALEHALAAGDPNLVTAAHYERTAPFLELGDLAAADAEMAALETQANRSRLPLWQALVPLYRAMRALLSARFADAEAFAREFQARSTSAECRGTRPAGAALAFSLLWERGRVRELDLLLESPAFPLAGTLPWRVVRLLLRVEHDDRENARAQLELLAQDDFSDLVGTESWHAAVSTLAIATAYLRDTKRAARLMTLLEPRAGCLIFVGNGAVFRGPAALYLGLLARTLGDLERAEKELEEAVETCERIGAPLWRARAEIALAALQGERGRPEEAARTLARSAKVAAIAPIGAVPWR